MENASQDIRDVLTSADPHSHPVAIINLIKSLSKHHHQRNEWSLIDIGPKICKLRQVIFSPPVLPIILLFF